MDTFAKTKKEVIESCKRELSTLRAEQEKNSAKWAVLIKEREENRKALKHIADTIAGFQKKPDWLQSFVDDLFEHLKLVALRKAKPVDTGRFMRKRKIERVKL
jgi:septal ring factor EnvC (AmiA/AmiB activator)